MPITLSSPTIHPAETHFVLYDLQTAKKRKAFFGSEHGVDGNVGADKMIGENEPDDNAKIGIFILPDR